MPIDLDAMTQAVSAGVAEASSGSTPPPSEPTGGNDDGSADAAQDAFAGGEEDAPGADEGSVPGTTGATEGDGCAAQDADGDSGASDGTGSGDDQSADGEAPSGADGKPAAKGGDGKGEVPGKDPAAKAPDPLNDPLPNALKKETKERFRTLIGMVKDTTSRAERAEAERDEMMGYIRETQATPEQYGQALTYLKLVNSPNRADKEAALQIMQQEIAALARMIGKPVPGVNMLEGHDDLIAEVGAGRLTMERAAEIAAFRESQNFQQRQSDAARQQQQAAQALDQARAAAKGQLNALEQHLLANDPAYKAKRPILIAQMRPIFAKVHPSQWPAMFKAAYDAMPAPAVQRPTSAPSTVPRNTPIGGRNPAGGATPEPKTMAEAVELGLRQAR